MPQKEIFERKKNGINCNGLELKLDFASPAVTTDFVE